MGSLWAQKPFTGSLTFVVTLQDSTGDQLKDYLPDTLVQYWHPRGMRMEYRGQTQAWAHHAGSLLYLADSAAAYLIDTSHHTVQKQETFIFSVPGMAMPAKWGPVLGSEMIAGYPCTIREARMNLPMAGGRVRYQVWTSPQLKVPQGPGWDHILHEPDLQGSIPLRKLFLYEAMDLRIHLQVIKVQTALPADTLFALPQGYALLPFMPTIDPAAP
ncbi:MAG: hypothetical protein KF690_01345 [Bacteroidetes bacterium]|nr:hypothetical protein [Bacteroidota bacterium]